MSKVTTKSAFDPSFHDAVSNEPDMQFFSSFEEENEATARMNARLTPEENLMKAHQLLLKMYGGDYQISGQDLKEITFVIVNGIAC